MAYLPVRCGCGAVGRLLPPDFAYRSRDGQKPLMEWRGGRVELGRLALEDAREGETSCPACQHRSCVFMLSRGQDSASS
jgi:hypothetical protein